MPSFFLSFTAHNMDTLLQVLPSSKDCRATARIVGRRSVVPCRDGAGEFVPPLNIEELDPSERTAVMARGGKPYVVYRIEMAQVTPFRKSWSVEKRYREFVSFALKIDKQLSAKNKKGARRRLDIKLPKKQLFMVDENFLQKRQHGLDQWIQQIPKLFDDDSDNEPLHEAIRSFLLPPALNLLRHKRIQSDTGSISSITSDTTPPNSPSMSPHQRNTSSATPLPRARARAAASHASTGGIQGLANDDVYIASPVNDAATAAAVAAFEEEQVMENDGNLHPQQALALVSSGSYVVEWTKEDNTAAVNTFTIPVERLSNVITIVYRDGCYTYFRASLLLRRIVKADEEKEEGTKPTKEQERIQKLKQLERKVQAKVNKWLKIPDDNMYSDTGTAMFPVRYQDMKVGYVKVHAKLKESETLRKSLQLKFKKIRTYGPLGVLLGCMMLYLSTWLLMVVATVLGFLGYGLFRPLHRELELTIVPSNSTSKRLDEVNNEKKRR
jgi:hypothetical protein